MNRTEALNRAYSICARQEQSRQDIGSKLKKWDVSEADIEYIISALEKEGFIDLLRYAQAFTVDKFTLNKWGKIKIRWMLRQKEIPEEIIEKALSIVSDQEYEILLTIELKKKLKNLHSKSEAEKKGKLIQFASQRGFEYEIIHKVIHKL
jgi:regulatory protein